MTWVLVSLLGLLAGVVSGLFGVGGAVVTIPGLVLIAKLPQHLRFDRAILIEREETASNPALICDDDQFEPSRF